MSPLRKWVAAMAILSVSTLALAPTALSTLAGSGNLTDVVQLSTTTGTLGALGSTAGAPITSGASAFVMTNSGTNVDTFVRYAWGTPAPYYGSNSGQTSLSLRGTTHYIGDLLWFKQEWITGGAVATMSEYYSPLIVKNAASVATVTFTSSGNACTAWSGTEGSGFSKTAAGTFTFKYHAASGQTDNTPTTSDTFHYCLDTTNSQVYLAKSAGFASATRVYTYTTDSTGGVLSNYQYQALNGAQTNGNFYCLNAITGSGVSATPDLVQCQKLPFDATGSTTVKLYAMYDPPSFFPSTNQGGALTYAISGTQWNPYAYTTTNSA